MTTFTNELSPTAIIYVCDQEREDDAFQLITPQELDALIAQRTTPLRALDLEVCREYFEMNRHDPRVMSLFNMREQFFQPGELSHIFNFNTLNTTYSVYVIA